MGKMVKRYVLVDKEIYDRKFSPNARTEKAQTLPNPFQNPDVIEAKKLRSEMYELGGNTKVDVGEANRQMQEMMREYLSRFASVGSQRKSPKISGKNLTKSPQALYTPKRERMKEELSTAQTPRRKSVKTELRGRKLIGGESGEEETDEEELIPFTTPTGKLDAIDRRDVATALGGHLTSEQLEKAYPVVNEMFKVGMLKEDGKFVEVNSDGSKWTSTEVRNALRDVLFNSPSHRLENPTRANRFIDYLRRRRVVETDLKSPKVRTSKRQRTTS